MRTRNIEGIVLSKLPFQERHLICKILLRTGQKVSVLFYGGMGGGKKQKVTGLEFGHLIKITLAAGKRRGNLLTAKEWVVAWSHKEIRLSHRAFLSLCFYLELIDKVSVEAHYDELDLPTDHGAGPFKVLSNAIFYLEKASVDKNCSFLAQRFTFLAKLLIDQGVFPDLHECLLTGGDLGECSSIHLSAEHGGFVNLATLPIQEQNENDWEVWQTLIQISSQKYQNLQTLVLDDINYLKKLFHFFCFQFHFEKRMFKTFDLLS